MMRLNINGKTVDVDVEPDTPLLWVIREQGRPDRHEIRLRHRAVRRLHGAHRRRGDALLRRCRSATRRQEDHHHRGPRAERRAHPVQKAWIEHDVPQCGYCQKRHDHGGRGAAEGEAEADRRGYRRRDHQHLPLRHLPAGARGDPCRGARRVREGSHEHYPENRLAAPFLVGTAAAGGGLALGFHVPFGGPQLCAPPTARPKSTPGSSIKPDDTVVIRIARSEMGQGTLTGLAQLVAEELECDWSKVTTEYPTPGQNVARKRVWGDFSTGGSRGIRTSHEYVRKGGAAAREMLVQAAANEWKVPAAECIAANSVITHTAVRPQA